MPYSPIEDQIGRNRNTLRFILHLPIMPQELVPGVWLIVRGFDKPALAALERKAA